MQLHDDRLVTMVHCTKTVSWRHIDHALEYATGTSRAPDHVMALPISNIAGDRARRVAREAAQVDEARAAVAAGRAVGAAEVNAWTDSIATDHEFPPRYPKR
jgi:predicted transcriptional regulator